MNLTTQRLQLREVRASDLNALFGLYSDPLYQRYEGQPLSQEDVREKLDKTLSQARVEPRTCYWFAITFPPQDTLVGQVSLKENNAAIREWEIGWGMAPACWGMGYASEAARAVLAYAFEELKAHRMVAFCHARNLSSVRVMEKIGLEREGQLRQVRWLNGRWCDEYVYSILEEELFL